MTVDHDTPLLDRITMAWLRETFPDELATVEGVLRIRTETVDNLRDFLAANTFFVRVGQLPGRTTRTQITATVDIDVFGLNNGDTQDLANAIDSRFITGRHQIATGASLDTVISQMSPYTVPWADAGVRRYYSSYAVTARR